MNHSPVGSESLRVEPFDAHNQTLVSHVHPPGWVNPTPRDKYDLVVIGAGTAGLVTAAGGAGLGARVALIERHMMGGDCLNVGCVPSKGVISAARSWAAARSAHEIFGGPRTAGGENFAEAMERMRRLRAGLSHIDGAPRFAELGVDVFFGQGRFVDPTTVEIGGARLKFRKAVIATGARAATPELPGLAQIGYLTNETIFTLTELPARLVVIGAGPIGCEMAQAFARFGSRVTIVDRGETILHREDPDAARIVQSAMERDGVVYEGQAKLIAAEREGPERVLIWERAGKQYRAAADAILVAAGRTPNVEGLGLDAAGVAFDNRGVTVDDRLRTTNRRVFAVGDICSPFKFTHTADAQARIVLANALFFGRQRNSRLVVPWATYTSPEIAHVGMYERDARAAGVAIDTFTVSLEHVDRAVLDGQKDGFCRVHVQRGTDRIVGATIVAEHAGEMISELTLAITAGVGLGKIGATIHPYPTQAEVIRKTADAWRRTKLTPRAKAILGFVLRLFR